MDPQEAPTPNNKRRRTEEDVEPAGLENLSPSSPIVSGAASGPFLRDDVFWFDDGSVILISQGPNAVAFKLHLGILSHHSAVFRDLFAKPGGEEIEGIPVFRLQHSSSTLRCLCSALYDGQKSQFFCRSALLSFELIDDMLELGDRYEIAQIRNEAVERLRLCLPSRCTELGAFEAHMQRSLDGVTINHCIRIINLARRYKCLVPLRPVAYFGAYLVPNSVLRFGFQYRGDCEQISNDDLWIVLNTRENLLKWNIKFMAFLAYPPSLVDRKNYPCCVQNLSLFSRNLLIDESILTSLTAWATLDPWLDEVGKRLNICSLCLQVTKQQYAVRRDNRWAALSCLTQKSIL